MLGELIARAGAGGVQVLVETHSDHIMNGIRIAVKEKKIQKENVQIAFFYKDAERDYVHTYESLQVNEDGKLNHWPKGFLDEWENALMELL
jgi:predicted ATPase